ncbi:MAG TPA: H-X9-DG-CTERM domain-containing protein, partial [Pirellulales bacterium]|nr:H-X9-DG-CTERM domain-containing protein [Pirellulales bacterium]
SCRNSDPPNWQQTARSMHPGGVNVCMADGSVHWISDNIQVGYGTAPNPTLGVWDKLMLSNDGESLSSNSY